MTNSATNQLIQNLTNPRDTDNEKLMEDAMDTTRTREGFVYASEMLDFNARQTIVHCLLLIVKGAFISPVKAYEAQVEANKCTQCISMAAKKQVAKSTADKTAEILEAEAAEDPKIVRVMIQQAVEKAVDKRMEKEKKGVQKHLRNRGQKKKQQQKCYLLLILMGGMFALKI